MAMAYSACAQVISGTVIVINRTEDQLIVAADSRVTTTQFPSAPNPPFGAVPSAPILSGPVVSPPNDSYCKIAVLKNQVIFTAVGHPDTQGRLASVNTFDEARSAVNETKKTSAGQSHLEEVANNWCARMKNKWNDVARENLFEVMDLAKQGDLIGGVFAEASQGKIYVKAAHVTATVNNTLIPLPNIECSLVDLQWTGCGQQDGKQMNIDGHSDVATNFCSERKSNSKISVRTPLKCANSDTELAVQLVELTIDASGSGGDVGGNVDAVTLSKDGRITWNSNPDCPENQD